MVYLAPYETKRNSYGYPSITDSGMAAQQTVFATDRFNRLCTPEEHAHFSRSKATAKYLERKRPAIPGSAMAYGTHLRAFSQYISRKQGTEVDEFIEKLKAGMDPYDELAGFASFLKLERKGQFAPGANIQRDMVKTAKRFLRFSKVPVTNKDFKEQVSLPRKEEQNKKPLGKKVIINLLNAAGPQLKTFLIFSGVFGPRPIEACAVRNRDLDIAAKPAGVTFRAQYSKMRLHEEVFKRWRINV